MQHRFNTYLEYYIIQPKKDGKVTESHSKVPATLKMDLSELIRLNEVHDGIEDFYRNEADGFGFEWWADKENGIGGKLEFASTKDLFSDADLYDEGDNEDLQYFHPLDYPSPESYVGFVIRPDSIYKSLYYVSISDYQLYNLDLDFNGYTQMAVEARVFNRWQKVLLYYMGVSETGSSETETFKAEMPKIFPDWTWENFIAKFENLRLSNNT
ncbi:hypothetical protein ACLI1A_10460 [Flavobacterium sp. RHBU_3]|uniref:hypothetical protein n=1 Tax=Flavobacterium sp. RHBU_3 TaxID=3391184 RepID=UPI003984AA64